MEARGHYSGVLWDVCGS